MYIAIHCNIIHNEIIGPVNPQVQVCFHCGFRGVVNSSWGNVGKLRGLSHSDIASVKLE